MRPLIIVSIFIVLATLGSCKREKEYDCWFSYYYYRGCGISFKGYSPEEINTIRWISYQAGSNFSRPVDSQWVYTPDVTRIDSALYRKLANDSISTFVELKLGLDYQISTQTRTYRITDIQTGDSGFSYKRSTPCLGGHFSVLPFSRITVDGVPVIPAENQPGTMRYFAWLQK